MRSRLLSGASTLILGRPQAIAGAKLISRRWFMAGATIIVPDGAGWISARAVGSGGNSDAGGGYGGGGGALAREDRACSPGQSVAVTMSPQGATGNRTSTEITLAGTLIARAVSAIGQNAGLDTNSIGTVRASGGAGSIGAAASSGVNGGMAGSGNVAGGGSGGESNATDALILGGIGASTLNGRGGFPGGGAALTQDTRGTYIAAGGDPTAVIEFWSAKP